MALLRDSKGRIKLQVPVKGNVKDPQFDFAKTIQSALTGTIEDAGSDPFAVITAVDGFTGEELSTVAFEFGFSELRDREIQKLNALATVLKEREALTLGIAGTADRIMDGSAIMGASPQAISSGDDSAVEDENPVIGPATDQTIDDDLLEQLAQRRAEAVSAYLIEETGIDATRLELKPVQINSKPDGEERGVVFSLSAECRR